MRTLVLGGTAFVGRAIVEELLAREHEVTLFVRGRTGADLFPAVPRLLGDRAAGDYAAVHGGTWDNVVDVTGYVPRHVEQAVGALAGGFGRYLFISTGSVYDKDQAPEPLDESCPRLAPERGTEEITGDTYGPLKVACEDDLGPLGEAATIVRPGVVAGPHDPTDRFTWWARRAVRGGRLAVPGRLEQPVQVVDSRDLARLVVQLLEDDRPGTYNAVGPAEPVTLEGLLQACAAGAGTEVEPVPVAPRDDVPLVVPTDWDVMFRRSAEAARAVGLTATPLEQTARDVQEWDRARGLPTLSAGPDDEDALLGDR